MSEADDIKMPEYAEVGPAPSRSGVPPLPILEAILDALIAAPFSSIDDKREAQALAVQWTRQAIDKKKAKR